MDAVKNTTVSNAEAVTVLKLIRQLNFDAIKEFCYMIEGAKIIAERTGDKTS